MKRNWNSIMFDNVGVKIQTVAKIYAWFQITLYLALAIGMVILGCVFFSDFWYFIFFAPLLVLVGGVVAWLSVLLLYGFGKLIEDTSAIRKGEKAAPKQAKPAVTKTVSAKPPIIVPSKVAERATNSTDCISVACPECGKPVSVFEDENHAVCPWCNTNLERRTPVTRQRRAPVSLEDIAFMEKPDGFTENTAWANDIKGLGTEELIQRYNDTEEWSEDYRYLCYKELKRRKT